ncbi:beta-ketoacyl synthase N-terminal-like domain-containing protein [Actinokineospora enzanensis]|uniref:beta-ketoacyl synthase N-terminal-like domain-containing protein n=1 Tax=Actinokineospora enzanensis TaxID=155975 RepID=UPI0003807EEB|nr:beta-ketoacyl synthase N-terminal-like domain-containing protein [Actinokineospora enzanensis]
MDIVASAVRTCLGDGAETFDAVVAGRCGVADLPYISPDAVHVRRGYPIAGPSAEDPLRASRLLTACVAEAVGSVRLAGRVVALVGTGLGELRAVERAFVDDVPVAAERLHFADAVRAACPAAEVRTVSNACGAGGHVLALAQDMLELGDADVVVVAATDSVTESMLAMIGRVADEPADRVRPFDVDRPGVLLGEGAAAFVLVRSAPAPLARVLATGLSCDAHHETAPDPTGIRRAVDDALERSGRAPEDVDLVLAHGTGTALNDPVEAGVLGAVYGDKPLVSGLKGAIGHTSGASALHSLDVAVRALRAGVCPPIVGLRTPLPEAAGLRLAGERTAAALRTAVVDAFGFGGVNAVTVVEAVR